MKSSLALALLLAASLAHGASTVTGAGRGTFPQGAALGTVSLSALRFGIGVGLSADGIATGDFQAVLQGVSLGQPRTIVVTGLVSKGSSTSSSATFSGVGTLDMGDGQPPAGGTPFTVTTTPGALTLTIGTATLPAAAVGAGSLRVR